jgi:hypothetical protein
MAKEGYKPTSGMQSAARRAIKLKEQGKAKGAGTAVGWTRAGQLARGETLSLSTVKRMYSYFSRHEVDKKGKDWNNSENPSNGKIMWLAWGGDAGYSWSRKIVEREKNKKTMKKTIVIDQDLIEEIKTMLEDVVDPITDEVIVEDDLEKSLRPEVTREQMYAVIEHLTEAIQSMIEMPEEESEEDSEEQPEEESDMESLYKEDKEDKEDDSEDEDDHWDEMNKACWTGYVQRGMKEKNGRMVPNCVPVKKAMQDDLENFIKEMKEKYSSKEVK